MASVAIVSGTGFYDVIQECHLCIDVETPYSDKKTTVFHGKGEFESVYFLPRHGKEHVVAPHGINYRANIYALAQLGVEKIIAINVVGAIQETLTLGDIVLPDQVIDYTYGREHTFYGEKSCGKNSSSPNFSISQHIDFAEPFNRELRQELTFAVQSLGDNLIQKSTYGCTQGPRLETVAEINRMKNDGCDIVGMTLMPEAALAMEKHISYASLCVCVNYAAGVSNKKLDLKKINLVLDEVKPKLIKLIKKTLTNII